MADGDGRYLLTLAETLFTIGAGRSRSTPTDLGQLLQKRSPAYDKDREEHYNLISALHKSMRGSDPDAALYWLARMLTGGEDPLFIARRLIRAAAEDIGEADPMALLSARTPPRTPTTSWARPEGELALAQLVVHLADRAQVERGLQGLRRGHAGGAGDRLADAAAPHPATRRPS